MNAIETGIVAWALARLGERSTWLGLAAVVGGMSFLPHAEADAQIIAALGVVISGVAAIVHREKGSKA